jgi:hypothetical protein
MHADPHIGWESRNCSERPNSPRPRRPLRMVCRVSRQPVGCDRRRMKKSFDDGGLDVAAGEADIAYKVFL